MESEQIRVADLNRRGNDFMSPELGCWQWAALEITAGYGQPRQGSGSGSGSSWGRATRRQRVC